MGNKVYSYKKNKSKSVSKHFKVYEFAARDGDVIQTDRVVINTELVNKLEKFFNYNVKTVEIIDGNRTTECSKKWGGGGDDAHTRGIAADIACYDKYNKRIPAKYVACLAQLIGFNGIGIMNGTCHVDARTTKTYKNGHWFGNELTNENYIEDFFDYADINKAKLFGILEHYDEKCYYIKATEKAPIRVSPSIYAKIKKYYEKGKKARVFAEENGYLKVLSGWIKKSSTKKAN